MTITRNLERASSVFFFCASLLSKFQYLPIPLVSAICRFLSLGLYLIAYGLWFSATLFHPHHQEHQNKWYGFAQIKEQLLLSSFTGMLATVLSIVAVFIPPLFLPAVWLFVIGNTLWTVGEYHKLKNPPLYDENFSTTRQQSYISYSIATTIISLVAATAYTLMFFFTPLIIPITIVSLILCAGLAAFAFDSWLDTNFGDHKPIVSNSYKHITDGLGGPSAAYELTDFTNFEPNPNPLIQKSHDLSEKTELDPEFPLTATEPGVIFNCSL